MNDKQTERWKLITDKNKIHLKSHKYLIKYHFLYLFNATFLELQNYDTLQVNALMKNADATNRLMPANTENEDLARRLSVMEQQFTLQKNAMRQQLEEMNNHSKFYISLYSDLKLDFIRTKHIVFSKINATQNEQVSDTDGDDLKLLSQKEFDEERESETIKALQEEVRQLKLENSVLKAKLALREQENGSGNSNVHCNGGVNWTAFGRSII